MSDHVIIVGNPLCLIIEFAAQGSLKHFLTLCKEKMKQQLSNNPPPSATNNMGYYNEPEVTQSTTQLVTQSTTQPVTQLVTKPVIQYINTDSNWYMYEEHTGGCNGSVNCKLPQKDYSSTTSQLGVMDICYFLLQIAKGMEHIGKMKVSKGTVHEKIM